MNCKQGDIAIVVRSIAGNEGKIVRCLRLATEEEITQNNILKNGTIWRIDIPLAKRGVRTRRLKPAIPFARDANLRPIRDPGTDATDETLTWLPVPTKEAA